MGESVLERINELARKAKAEGLTTEEQAERDELRKIYLENFRGNLRDMMERVYVEEPDGTKRKLEKKQKD